MPPIRGSLLIVAVLVLAAACVAPGSSASPEEPGSSSTPEEGGPLLASVQATTQGDGVRFVLQVTNTSDAPVELNFSSGQSFDFVVTRDGREVWRWSSDQMFTQALRTETLAPGETRTHQALWAPTPRATGEYQVTGILTATDHRVQQSARFRL